MGLIEKVEGFLKTDGDHVEENQEAEKQDTETEEAETQVRTRLYQCSPCETTYVTLQMELCPECGEPLEGIPNESDLGMT